MSKNIAIHHEHYICVDTALLEDAKTNLQSLRVE